MTLPDHNSIPSAFITHAANILGDTAGGLSGPEIVRYCADYAVDFNVNIPHASYPFEASNKRTALKDKLSAFSPEQQYRIIKAMCELDGLRENQLVKDLKIKLVSSFSQFSGPGGAFEINETLIEEEIHARESY